MLDFGEIPSPENKNDNSHKEACTELRTRANGTEVKGTVQHAWFSVMSFSVNWASLNKALPTINICNCPWPKFHIHFSISHCWYKGVEEAHSTQYKRYSFSWKGRVHARGP